IATRKVRPADRSRKKAIADKYLFLGMFDQNDVAACVSGAMPRLKTNFAEFEYIAILPVSRKPRRFVILHAECGKLRFRNSEKHRLRRQSVIKIFVIFMKNDLCVWKAFREMR